MRGCEIQRETRDDVDIVRLDGALDAYSFPRLEHLFDELEAAHRHRVILACDGLHYISSAALGALVGFARRARERGGDLKLVAVSPKIQSIIELFGFHQVLDLVPDTPQALTHFDR